MSYPLFALMGIAGTSFTLALSGALMPGPLLTVTIAEAARRGTKAGPLVITGHAILELLLVITIINGLGQYLKAPPVIGTISLMGGIILLAMGVDMMRKAAVMSLHKDAIVSCGKGKGSSSGYTVILGAVGSLVNPYWILWWLTIGLGYMTTAGNFGLPGITAFFTGHITADYAWYIMIAFGIHRGKNIVSDKGYRTMIRGCGIFLVCFGFWFLNTAYHHLFL